MSEIDREEVLRSLREFQNSAGYAFMKELISSHLREKAREMGDLMRLAEKKNDYMIYRISGYLDGFENGAQLVESAINEIKPKDKKEDKPIY